MTEKTAVQLKFTGSLTRNDSKTYHPFTFDVPEGTTNIHLDFQYAPHYATGRIHANQINVSINDPDGLRGQWNFMQVCDINGILSSPGMRTAPIQPGTWIAFVESHRILGTDTVTYELTVTLSSDPLAITPSPYKDMRKVASTEQGWYRGDLHAHTIHSDGRWDIPEFTRYMRNFGLDFVSLSDHNTITGLNQHRSQTEDGFLALGGMELSTVNGHMLALGGNDWYEWRLNLMDIDSIMQQVIDRNELLIIAHPMTPDEPFCSGCMWLYEEARPGVALGVEVWNGVWNEYNDDGLHQYYAWLNVGNRLFATTGSDIHEAYPPNDDGRKAFNIVYADQLSEEAILAAVRKGHSYVSAGPELLLNAETASGEAAMCGDLLPAEAVTLKAVWRNAHPGDVLRLIVEGQIKEELPADSAGEQSWSFAAGEAKWATVELRDARNSLWAVSNPIFFGDSWRA
ncbi:MAG: CehA/McbA family metallohydrolase [Chloroflexota bacterium]